MAMMARSATRRWREWLAKPWRRSERSWALAIASTSTATRGYRRCTRPSGGGSRDGARLIGCTDPRDDDARGKGIHPNLDFPTGPAYHLMGFDIPTFTPIFVMARITGWTAHVIEQFAQNSLIRPLSSYVGHPERHVAR